MPGSCMSGSIFVPVHIPKGFSLCLPCIPQNDFVYPARLPNDVFVHPPCHPRTATVHKTPTFGAAAIFLPRNPPPPMSHRERLCMSGGKNFVYLKASHFGLSIQNFLFPRMNFFFGFGWVGGWFGLGAGVLDPTPPPPLWPWTMPPNPQRASTTIYTRHLHSPHPRSATPGDLTRRRPPRFRSTAFLIGA